jgi:serine/threonine-protein kinase RsbW
MSFEIAVPAGPAAPATVRRALIRWLEPLASNGLLSDAPLVVSELVTNSMRHGGLSNSATVRVSAELTADFLRLEVEDPGTAGTVRRRPPSRDQDGGFGLNIVNAVSARWGVERDGGTLVWAELATPRSAG